MTLAPLALIEMLHFAVQAVSHSLRSFIRASLSMNPDSFIDRFTAIPCAVGSAFEAVDLNIERRNDELIWEMTSVSASQSQEDGGEHHDNHPFKCRNCRFVNRHRLLFARFAHVSPFAPAATPCGLIPC